MPLIETKGAASAQGFGEFAQASTVANYIENVFSTYLYTGNGSTQTITNGIDLSTKGGLVWFKSRSASYSNALFDTVRGFKALYSDSISAQSVASGAGRDVTSYNADGFSLGIDQRANINSSGTTFASWTFQEQPKFFDIVTYTGTGSSRTIAHNLGSAPGFMIIKSTSVGDDWYCYHRSLSAAGRVLLNSTGPYSVASNMWNNTAPTSTVFTLGSDSGVNGSGVSYVAYLFAHNAGGFGLTGTDNVISCGSFTSPATNSSVSVNLGYEPQWILFKDANNTADAWYLADSMRGLNVTSVTYLSPNNTNSEGSIATAYWSPNATGFSVQYGASYWFTPGNTVIYIAIRRGPMKVPTDATKVFSPVTYTGDGTNGTRTITTNFPVDSAFSLNRTGATGKASWNRLIGNGQMLITNTTAAQVDQGNTGAAFGSNTGLIVGGRIELNYSGYDYVLEAFQRAPSFFDEVCYTGTGVTHTETHNLGVAPELIIVKRRASATASWAVYAAPLTASYVGFLDLTNAFQADNMWNSTAPTSTAFTVRAANAQVNASGSTYVAYLFATCAGVSKVGSYTGTGATQTISCGFTGGARFVLVKRTDSTGDWYVWDTARGMVSGTDPSLLLNTQATEVNANSIYTTTGGFQIVSTAAGINASGGTYIFLAIA